MANLKFPKITRIHSKKDFRAILDYKCFVKNELMKLYIASNGTEKSRFAVSISSKIAPAAVRNRLKRLAREAFRLSQSEIEDGFDYFLIYSVMLSKMSNSDIKKTTLKQVQQSFIELAKRGHKRFEKERNK
jgi:ribonuclease P protein component